MEITSKNLKENAELYRTWAKSTSPGVIQDLFNKRAVELDELSLVMEKIEELKHNLLIRLGLNLT